MSAAPVPLVNFSIAQFCKAGCSSLRKMPRYLTVGESWEHPDDAANSELCLVVVTSAHLAACQHCVPRIRIGKLTNTTGKHLQDDEHWVSILSTPRTIYHAPNCSEWSYSAKIVPRLSAPMITYALLTPGSGFATSLVRKASHLP